MGICLPAKEIIIWATRTGASKMTRNSKLLLICLTPLLVIHICFWDEIKFSWDDTWIFISAIFPTDKQVNKIEFQNDILPATYRTLTSTTARADQSAVSCISIRWSNAQPAAIRSCTKAMAATVDSWDREGRSTESTGAARLTTIATHQRAVFSTPSTSFRTSGSAIGGSHCAVRSCDSVCLNCYWNLAQNSAIDNGEWGGPGSCATRLCQCDLALSKCLRHYYCPKKRPVCVSSPFRLLQNLVMVF